VTEAGGTVTGLLPGEELDLFQPRCLASNGRIHAGLLGVLEKSGVRDLPR